MGFSPQFLCIILALCVTSLESAQCRKGSDPNGYNTPTRPSAELTPKKDIQTTLVPLESSAPILCPQLNVFLRNCEESE